MLTGDDHMNTNDVSGARAQGGAGSPDAWSSHNGHCGLRPDPDKLIPALLIITPITSVRNLSVYLYLRIRVFQDERRGRGPRAGPAGTGSSGMITPAPVGAFWILLAKELLTGR